MEYTAFIRLRPSVTAAERDAAFVRRASWQYPEGIRPIAEHWPSSSEVQVVSVFAADDYAAVMQLIHDWSDVFTMDVHPSISAEEGLRVGPEMFSRLTRLQRG